MLNPPKQLSVSDLYFRFQQKDEKTDVRIASHLSESSHTERMPGYRLREISKCIPHLVHWWWVMAFLPVNVSDTSFTGNRK